MSDLWTAEEAARATGGTCVGGWSASGVSIDTRSLARGELFVALTAERDGHDFVAAALDKGAAAAMVSRQPDGVSEDRLLIVDDVQRGLEALGRVGRARFGGRVLAITGSVGKTTAKEMARTALSDQLHVHAAEASYNNHWGVPLTLARLDPRSDVAVIEIGMNHPGEIAPLAALAQPDVAVITNVAPAHLAAFTDVDAIAREKASIFTGLRPGGTAIVNADLPTVDILRSAAPGRVVTFGSGPADWRLMAATLHGESTVVEAEQDGTRFVFRIGGAGRHLALNALAIIAAIDALGFDSDRAAQALATWIAGAGRGRSERVLLDRTEDRGIALIDDAFNANPASMAAALDRLIASVPDRGGRRIAILGDMLELGSAENALHAAIADHPGLDVIDVIHCAGPRMSKLYQSLPTEQRGVQADTAEELADEARHLVKPGDIVLVKGSKGARTARIVDAIRKLGQSARRSA